MFSSPNVARMTKLTRWARHVAHIRQDFSGNALKGRGHMEVIRVDWRTILK
jgi:hypothetical protein